MKIAVVGCGVMGGAIARQTSRYHQVLLYDHKTENSFPLAKEIGAEAHDQPEQVISEADAVILAIKPKDLAKVAMVIAPFLTSAQFLLSILAGTPLETLKGHFSKPTVFRLMPNLPLLCGKGMIGVVEEAEVTPASKGRVEEVLQGLGEVTWLKESQMNAFTALTGSNPAYIYVIIESMVAAGVELGFKSDAALELILQTFEGSVALLRELQTTPEKLKKQIASPGGATIAGLNEMEAQRLRFGMIQTLKQTVFRAEEMEREHN